MSTVNRNEVMNEIYDSVLVTLGLVGLSWGTNKVFIMKLIENINSKHTISKMDAIQQVDSNRSIQNINNYM